MTATALASCVFDLEIVEDQSVRPTILMPGQNFVKRWVVRNNGTCPWEADFRLVYVSGEQMGGPESVEVEPVGVGEEWRIELPLQAPTGYATHTGVWQLQDGEGHPVGAELQVVARVDLTPTPPPPTATPLPPTPESTPTPLEPLHMSVPILWGTCTEDVWNGVWGGTLVWSAGGGTGTYHYFHSDVQPDFELAEPSYTFSTQTGRRLLMKFFTTSAGLDVIGALPQGCCDGTSGRYVTPGGVEVVWQTVNVGQGDCP